MEVARWRTVAHQVCMRADSGQAHPSTSSSLQLRKLLSQTIFLLYNIDAPDRDESFGQGAQARLTCILVSAGSGILISDLKRHVAHLLVEAHSINTVSFKIHPHSQLQCRPEILSSMGKQHLPPTICKAVCICLHRVASIAMLMSIIVLHVHDPTACVPFCAGVPRASQARDRCRCCKAIQTIEPVCRYRSKQCKRATGSSPSLKVYLLAVLCWTSSIKRLLYVHLYVLIQSPFS